MTVLPSFSSVSLVTFLPHEFLWIHPHISAVTSHKQHILVIPAVIPSDTFIIMMIGLSDEVLYDDTSPIG